MILKFLKRSDSAYMAVVCVVFLFAVFTIGNVERWMPAAVLACWPVGGPCLLLLYREELEKDAEREQLWPKLTPERHTPGRLEG